MRSPHSLKMNVGRSGEAPPPQFWGAGEDTRAGQDVDLGSRSLPLWLPRIGAGGLLVLSLLLLLSPAVRPAQAAPPAAPAAKPTPAAPAYLPDYGGRDSAPAAPEAGAPDPVGQAGRALGALVIVLVGVVGVVYALKRFGLVTPGANGKSARLALPLPGRAMTSSTPVSVLSSQTLPGGAMLHVVSVSGRTLVLAATPHTVTAVAEWMEDEVDDAAGFEDYLTRADPGRASGLSAANDRLRSLLSRPERRPDPLDDTP